MDGLLSKCMIRASTRVTNNKRMRFNAGLEFLGLPYLKRGRAWDSIPLRFLGFFFKNKKKKYTYNLGLAS